MTRAIAIPNPQPVQPIIRFQPGAADPLSSAIVRTALQALVVSGKTKATARAVERFVEPNALGSGMVTSLIIVTDLVITLS